MKAPALTPEQEAEAQQIFQSMQERARDRLLEIARLLASKPNSQLLGQTEFDLRDLLHQIGAETLQTALDGRKKGGTKALA